MTEEQKYNLIAKMLDNPATLTDDEIAIITADDELTGLLDMSARLKNAYAEPVIIDAEEEWKRFRPRLKRHTLMPSRRWMRVAAIILGVIFLSTLLVRLTDFVFPPGQSPLIADAVQSSHHDETVPMPTAEPAAPAEEETPPAKTTAKKSKKHNVAVKKEIDIDEYVRIRQAKIDNDIATMMEEIKAKENIALQQWQDNETETTITINI